MLRRTMIYPSRRHFKRLLFSTLDRECETAKTKSKKNYSHTPLPNDEELPMKTTTKKLSLALATALFALPLTAFAQDEAAAEEEASIYSWNATIASDYVFRGVSQTDEEASLQLGADLNFDSGFYVGVWASNVDFGAGGPDVELDTYIGWNTDLTEVWNLDLMLNRYNYIGEQDGFGDGDYNEFITTLAYDETYSFTFGYTNDVYNLSEDGFYYGAAGSWELGSGFGLDLGVGRSTFDSSTGYDDYTDWSVAVNRDFGIVNAALGYYGTDSSGEDNFGDTAGDRIVLSFSIGG